MRRSSRYKVRHDPYYNNNPLTPLAEDHRRGVAPEGPVREGIHLHEGPPAVGLEDREPVCFVCVYVDVYVYVGLFRGGVDQSADRFHRF